MYYLLKFYYYLRLSLKNSNKSYCSKLVPYKLTNITSVHTNGNDLVLPYKKKTTKKNLHMVNVARQQRLVSNGQEYNRKGTLTLWAFEQCVKNGSQWRVSDWCERQQSIIMHETNFILWINSSKQPSELHTWKRLLPQAETHNKSLSQLIIFGLFTHRCRIYYRPLWNCWGLTVVPVGLLGLGHSCYCTYTSWQVSRGSISQFDYYRAHKEETQTNISTPLESHVSSIRTVSPIFVHTGGLRYDIGCRINAALVATQTSLP